MDMQTLFNWTLGIAGGIGGWFIRMMWETQEKLRSDLSQLERDLPKTYVNRDDWRDQMREIKDMISKILDKLDDKADK